MVELNPLKLLSDDMQAKALAISKARINLASVEVGDDYFQAVESLREQIHRHEPCSGIYILTATANIGNVVDNWLKRMSLYDTTTATNLKNKEFLTEDGKEPVVFKLTPISYQWMVAGPQLKALTTSFTLYVGQRSRDQLRSRLREHCSSSAQTTAIKLAGTTVKDVRIQEGSAKTCFETFRIKDHALLREMGFKEIACDIIPVGEKEIDQIKYHESLIRTGLLPLLGRT